MITGRFIRQKFLEFMQSKGHAVIPSSSLIPKEDPTVLFNTAGMQPLVPYLTGIEKHPQGTRLANSQKCLRTVDIDEVGDDTHQTFFEMLGNWSVGDYFKKESIEWSFEFLTGKDWLGLNPKRIYVTTYIGGVEAPEDKESVNIWKSVFSKAGIDPEVGQEFDFNNPDKNQPNQKYRYRITQMGAKENWWGLPHRGPCGGDTEIFYLLDSQPVDFIETELAKLEPGQAYDYLETNLVEIWNNVFMEYEGEPGEINGQFEPVNLTPLKQKNVDTGMGLERVVARLNGFGSNYQTDLLKPIVDVVNKWSK
jgi:alanyl-tRNA synthetase